MIATILVLLTLLGAGYGAYRVRRYYARINFVERDATATVDLPSDVMAELRHRLGEDTYLKQAFIGCTYSAMLLEIESIKATRQRERESRGEGATYVPLLASTLPSRDEYVKAFISAWSTLSFPDYVREPGVFAVRMNEISPISQLDKFFHAFSTQAGGILHANYMSYQGAYYRTGDRLKFGELAENSWQHWNSIVDETPFESLFKRRLPIRIPRDLFLEGAWIIAPRGRGKTTLLSRLLIGHLKEVEAGGASIIVMDAKGELTNELKRAKHFSEGYTLHGKLTVIEPWDHLALNPFDLHTKDEGIITIIQYLINALLGAETTDLQGPVLNRAILAVRNIPDANLETLQDFLHDWHPYEQHVRKLPQKDRDFFLSGKYDTNDIKRSRDGIARRIDGVMVASPKMRTMFAAKQTKVDMAGLMDSGRVIVINNSRDILKGSTEFFSRFFLMLVLDAAEQRAGSKTKLPCYFYIDECDIVVGNDPIAAEIMNRCRSQRVGMVMAHQSLAQITNDKVKSAMADSSILLANAADDAASLKHLFHLKSAQPLQDLKRGEFMLWMFDQAKMPVKVYVNIPDDHVSSWNKMEQSEYAAIEAKMKKDFCYEPEAETVEDPEPPKDDSPQPWVPGNFRR